jgi:hypothetical protein
MSMRKNMEKMKNEETKATESSQTLSDEKSDGGISDSERTSFTDSSKNSEKSEPNVSDLKFNEMKDAIAAASYVEQILTSEHQWITNRLSWLFVSQSFCITAYTVLVTQAGVRHEAENQKIFLSFGLPILGIICSTVVGLSVRAAAKVGEKVSNERAKLTHYINKECGTKIPQVGVEFREYKLEYTHRRGALPEHLPWALVVFWIVFLILEIISCLKIGNG